MPTKVYNHRHTLIPLLSHPKQDLNVSPLLDFQMNDKPWEGTDNKQKLSVSNYRVQDRMQPGGAAYKQKTNLYVSGLNNNISELEVREMFAEFGPIRSILLKSPTP